MLYDDVKNVRIRVIHQVHVCKSKMKKMPKRTLKQLLILTNII